MIDIRQVKFTVYGNPKGKGRPRFARTGNAVRTYTPAETTNYENFVKLSYLAENKGIKLEGALKAEIKGYFPIPKATNKRQTAAMLENHIHHTKKIDCDNLAKTILDALNGIAYTDDRQICILSVEKLYSNDSRVEVIITELDEQSI